MTTLGQAYVQIMPSAKGISGSIQKTLNPEATAAGTSAGSNIASAISESMSKAGSKLTKSITLPVAGAMTAVTGLVTALGFKRLVGMDNARAKLEGMGYAGKNLDRKSTRLNSSHVASSYAVFCLKKKTPTGQSPSRAAAYANRNAPANTTR